MNKHFRILFIPAAFFCLMGLTGCSDVMDCNNTLEKQNATAEKCIEIGYGFTSSSYSGPEVAGEECNDTYNSVCPTAPHMIVCDECWCCR